MRKMDEMEMYITSRSVKIAWAYSVVFLLIWVVYENITTSKFGLPFFLLISQNLVLGLSRLILKHRMGNDEEQD